MHRRPMTHYSSFDALYRRMFLAPPLPERLEDMSFVPSSSPWTVEDFYQQQFFALPPPPFEMLEEMSSAPSSSQGSSIPTHLNANRNFEVEFDAYSSTDHNQEQFLALAPAPSEVSEDIYSVPSFPPEESFQALPNSTVNEAPPASENNYQFVFQTVTQGEDGLSVHASTGCTSNSQPQAAGPLGRQSDSVESRSTQGPTMAPKKMRRHEKKHKIAAGTRRKRTRPQPTIASRDTPNSTVTQQRRRNFQVSGSASTVPIQESPGLYRCPIPQCGMVFKDYQRTKRHIKTHFNDCSLCLKCGKPLSRSDSMRRHSRRCSKKAQDSGQSPL